MNTPDKRKGPKSVSTQQKSTKKRKSKKNDYITIDEKSIIPVFFGDDI